MSANGSTREPGGGGTLRGALLILLAGMALGAAWNTLGLASRPPWGIAWIPPAPTATRLEAFQPPGAVAAGTTAAHATAAPLPVIPDVPGPLTIELPAFKHLYDAGRVRVVDARERSQYEDGHIAGAVSLPFDGVLAEREKVRQLDAGGRAFVIYCSGGTCELSMDLAKVLVDSGKRKVLVFEGGYPAWTAAGYPVEHGPGIEP